MIFVVISKIPQKAFFRWMHKVFELIKRRNQGKVFLILTCLFLIVSFSLVLFHRITERNRYEAFLKKQFREIPEYHNEELSNIPEPDRPDLAAYHEYFMTVDPELKRVPVERLNKAFEQTKSIRLTNKLKSVTAPTLEWIGYSSDYGGRTRTLIFDPNDPENKKVWAGAVTGGLWYNDDITNSGSSWVPVDDFWDNLVISCIIADPDNPQIFYVGTGEASTAVTIYRESSGRGNGIWKTTNGGDTWSLIPSTEGFAYVTDIEVKNENGSSVIYAGVVSGKYKGSDHESVPSDGLYRSENGGDSWTQVLPDITGLAVPYAPSDIETGADGRIYIGTGRNLNGTGAATILYSDEGTAGTWIIFDDYKTLIESDDFYNFPGRVMLACAPSDENIVYALISSGYIRYDNFIGYYCRHILRSGNKGVTWKEINYPELENGRAWATLAWHALTVEVDPYDPNTLFIGGLDLFRTTNASADTVVWQGLSSWWNKGYDYNPENLPYVHADQHAIVFRPGSSEKIAFTTDGGVFYTSDGTAAEPSFIERNKNFTTLQFYTGAIHPVKNVNYYLGGLQDNGTLLFQDEVSPNFIFVSGGDGSYCFIDEDEPDFQITSVYRNLYYFVSDVANWNYIRYDEFYGTGTFINPADYDFRLNTLFANAMNVQGQYKDKLLIINNIPHNPDGYFMSLNTGSDVPFSFIHVSRYSPPESSTLIIGTQSGRLFKMENAQFYPKVEEITGRDFPTGNISCVAMGGSEDTLLVTFSNYGVASIWLTVNNGESWENKEGNLPDMPVRWCLLLPQDSRKALLATEIGVWSTEDLSRNSVLWQPAIDGMANVRVDMLQLRRSDNTVLAATHGRGFFTASYKANLIPDEYSDEKIDLYPNPNNGQFKISFYCRDYRNVSIEIFNLHGKIIKTFNTRCYVGPFSKTFDLRKFSSGLYTINISIGDNSYQRKVIIQ